MLRHRIVSGTIIGAAFLLALTWMPPLGAWVLLVTIAVIAQWEFYAMIRHAGIPVFRVIGVLCGVALITATFFATQLPHVATPFDLEHAILFLAVLCIFVRQFPQKHNGQPIETIACTLLGIFYVPYLFNFVTRLVFAWDPGGDISRTGRLLVLYLVLVVKLTDMGAFFVGRFLGKHKLCPRISPAKTWEGLAGGVLTALATSMVFYWVVEGKMGILTMRAVDAILLGIGLSFTAVVGDLFESLLKRACDKKDSGTSVPGMGGALDILDSLLFGAPMLYIYIRVFLYP